MQLSIGALHTSANPRSRTHVFPTDPTELSGFGDLDVVASATQEKMLPGNANLILPTTTPLMCFRSGPWLGE